MFPFTEWAAGHNILAMGDTIWHFHTVYQQWSNLFLTQDVDF